ncbi:restriction endonuclease subunit S [Helicobacter pylori]|nr:restriction endonuclease subunit S [Helicobacter pylori]
MDALTTPSNWQRVRLGDICEIVKGQQINKISLNNTDKYPVINGGIDFLGYTNKFNVSKNTIAISEGGTCGYVRFMKSDFWSGGHNYSLQKISNKVNNLCLYHILKSYEKDIMKLGVGSGLKNIQLKALKDFEIPLPPLNEQIAIANILSALDRYLYALRALILKKESVKKALSFELLSQRKRLKGFNQNWQRVRLGDIATFLKGKGLSKNQVSPNAKHECILYGELFTHYDRVVTNIKNFTNIYDNPMLSLNNDVLMPSSDVTPNGLATASCILKKGVILGGDILIIRPNSNLLNGCFLAYCIVYDKNQVLSKVVGSTVYHLYAKDMKVFEIPLPPLNEQIAIANILSALDHEIISLKNKKRQFENIKKALNHDLMSAKIRVLKK